MLSECNNEHIQNITKACCFYHLLIMSENASYQLLDGKYASLLLKTLNRYNKDNLLSFETTKLDIFRIFLEVISKYSSYYHFHNKNDYSKFLIKLALKGTAETPYKDHSDVITRKISILNNLACIYER